jgi:hypothetical protein
MAEDPAWWRYVVTVTGDASQKDIAAATGIDQSSISALAAWHEHSSR